MGNKRNVVLYLDSELVNKTRELGFNLSRTFENHMKTFIEQFSNVYSRENCGGWWAGPDLNQRPSARQAPMQKCDVDWLKFKEWLSNKYSETWVPTVFCYAKKYHDMLSGDFRNLESFSRSKRNSVLKALVALSKYLGIHRTFKTKMKDYGVKFEQRSSVDTFLKMMNTDNNVMEWVEECMNVLDDHSNLFIKFVMLSGLRVGEAINSFNKIIELHQQDKSDEYYNRELSTLEHFRFEEIFLRRTKNVFFTFMPQDIVRKIASSKPVYYSTFRKRLYKHNMHLRLKQLRHHFATFMVQNGLIREEVDLLQGRIGKSIFVRHYWSPTITELRNRVIEALEQLEQKL